LLLRESIFLADQVLAFDFCNWLAEVGRAFTAIRDVGIVRSI
jgi:hypothetical protein